MIDVFYTLDGLNIIHNNQIITLKNFNSGFIDIFNNKINYWKENDDKDNTPNTFFHYENEQIKEKVFNILQRFSISHELIQGSNKPRYYTPEFDYSTLNDNYLGIGHSTKDGQLFSIVFELNQYGEPIFIWSDLEHLEELELNAGSVYNQDMDFDKFLAEGNGVSLNAVSKIPKNNLSDKRFEEGNYLVSERSKGIIFIIDKDTKKVIWKTKPLMFNHHSSHYAHMIPNGLLGEGNILFYDNGGLKNTSKIIEFNPITFEIVFEYESEILKSYFRGSVQKTIKGTYLVCVPEQGRLVEIDKNKNIIRDLKLDKEHKFESGNMKNITFGRMNTNLLSFYRIEQIPYEWAEELIKSPFIEKEIKKLD
ncbi:MAG: hypothetical protein IKT40_06175 [Bacilli bacterium]|nr:hypothetical protein [Bacilli bacterium]